MLDLNFNSTLSSVDDLFHFFFSFHLVVDLFYSFIFWWVRIVYTLNTEITEIDNIYSGLHRGSDIVNNKS